MLGFVLSKINMLILVIAMFTIIAYFTFSLADIMKVHESQLLLTRLRDKADVMITAETYCDSTYHYFPDAIRVTGSDFYYVVKISSQEAEAEMAGGSTETLNYLIFSLFPRREFFDAIESGETPGALAAASVRTEAEIGLYEIMQPGGGIGGAEFTLIDPQGNPPADALVLVKQIEAGQQKLYVIPCSAATCEAYKAQASCLAAGPDTGCPDDEGAFNC